MMLLLAAGAPPLDPSAPDARQWLVDELSKPEYQAAKPSWFDIASKAIMDWITSLNVSGDGPAGLLLVAGVVVAVGLVVTALLVFGVPRLNRRARGARVFTADDVRTVAELRASAQKAADAGLWADAVVEMFRALARGLDERAVVTVSPGTTATEVARRAGLAFPDERVPLADAAGAFDDVRYLGRSGTEAAYRSLAILEQNVRGTTPQYDEQAAGAPR